MLWPGDAPMRSLAALVLAAGEGTRMKSEVAKPLIPVCGRPMLFHALDELELVGARPVAVVVGVRRDQVIAALAQRPVEVVVQDPPLGTGHAVRCAEDLFAGFDGDLIVTYADIPLLRAETLLALVEEHRRAGAAGTLLTAFFDDPTGYGRVVRGPDGRVTAVVEEKEADDATRAIREINTGVYVFEAAALFEALGYIEPSSVKGELYLTDTVKVLNDRGLTVAALAVQDPREVMGVNDRVQLAEAEAVARGRIRDRLMRDGVTMLDPATTYVDAGVLIGRDTVLSPGVHILGRSKIGANCTVAPNAYVENGQLGDGCAVQVGAILRDSSAGQGCSMGPYCHIRDGSRLDDGVRIGSYTEVVRSHIGADSRALHFSYLGDATLGEGVNIGAGAITCNFDGRHKHPTVIESGAFVGSDAVLIAPVRIGAGAYIAAGSVVTEDVPAGSLAIARERQTVRPDWASRRFPERGGQKQQ
jgi:bifunctional UDP-N-acetylglucosamine pyrophosphorylase/glucosamine-1-phosphate N-acetyltransferase